MMKYNQNAPTLSLGYDLDLLERGEKSKIMLNLSRSQNTHLLCIGQSGSGKSYSLISYLSKLSLAEPQGEILFADFKGEFEWLSGCPRYFPYKNAYNAVEIAYNMLSARLSGDDVSENPLTFIFDEYVSAILSQTAEDKKAAALTMSKISEILLMGRACGRASVRFWCFTQRCDSLVFPVGSREQFGGAVIALGMVSKEAKQMMFSDFTEDFKGRILGRGEGRVILNGSTLRHVKIGQINTDKAQALCKAALLKPL
ncbi:MAG: DUF87 domain-containing protein [Oscillospiraceae bacterium]|nr:DUF87 domain-containing protein [Oscillospiraceae bacterium]